MRGVPCSQKVYRPNNGTMDPCFKTAAEVLFCLKRRKQESERRAKSPPAWLGVILGKGGSFRGNRVSSIFLFVSCPCFSVIHWKYYYYYCFFLLAVWLCCRLDGRCVSGMDGLGIGDSHSGLGCWSSCIISCETWSMLRNGSRIVFSFASPLLLFPWFLYRWGNI